MSSPLSDTPTFKARVQTFWQWYAEAAARFYDTIEAGRCGDLTEEVVDFMAETLPGLSWVFGPGEGQGHSFTVSGEGQVAKQLLAEHWLNGAVELPNWTFYASRQPSGLERLKDFSIGIQGEQSIDFVDFLVATEVDEEAKKIDLVGWHPGYEQLAEEHHAQIFFLMLDEALGEFGTQTWIGEMEVRPVSSEMHTIPLIELPKFIDQVSRYHRWEKLSPLRSYSLYKLKQPSDSPRGDTIVGSTVIPYQICEYIDHGKLEANPLSGTGAAFAYVAIDSSVFPDGQQSDVRGNIEDALDDALGAELSGRTLGGAFGTRESYIDLLLLDGERSQHIVTKTLAELQLNQVSRLAGIP